MKDFSLKGWVIICLLLSMLPAAHGNTDARALVSAAQIEITEIKNVGVSAANETMSIIQVSWVTPGAAEIKIEHFDLQLEVTYADGDTERAAAKAEGRARRTRFEVHTLHRAPGRPAAELKSFKISITVNGGETITKQGAF
jgi:hypothetical protein